MQGTATLNQPLPTVSPMETLNDGFRQQNGQLEELISRLMGKLHQLSNTNVPTENANKAMEAKELPFRDGHLMYYHDQLTRNQYLLGQLENEVRKLESLI